MSGPVDAGALLDFWFGTSEVEAGGPLDSRPARPEWFGKRQAFDDAVRDRFGGLLDTIRAAGGLALLGPWVKGPSADAGTRLAFVLACDQLPRNAWRDQADAFVLDPLALACARDMVRRGEDTQLAPLARWFVYLPFEHSEALADQDEAVRLFGSLRDDPGAGGGYEWAVKHRDVIVRFGRFPHRNAILGRESTPEEAAFLSEPGSRF